MARTNKKLSAKALKSACNRHALVLQWCWNYEKMQGSGWGYAMVPVVKELYDDTAEQCRELERHSQFFNTNPFASALEFGACVALEEAYETEMSDSLKSALMGPLAAIGDTIASVLLRPPLWIMAASLANEGNWFSLVLVMLPTLITFVAKWPLFNYGYKKGAEIINDVAGSGTLNKLQIAASILGMTVLGGFVPSMINIKFLPIKVGEIVNEAGEVIPNYFDLQSTLDASLPKILPISVVALCYYLIKVKGISALKCILILIVLTFVLGALGVVSK